MNIVENPSEEFEREFIRVINARRKFKGVKTKCFSKEEKINLWSIISEQTEICRYIGRN